MSLRKNKEKDFSKKWVLNLKKIKKSWNENLVYCMIILQFHANNLKDQESSLGWSIIVITSLTSFITLLEFSSIISNPIFSLYYVWIRSLIISMLSITTTLLASWIKKRQFIKRIKELDKRVYEIEKIIGIIAAVVELPIEDRPQYTEFYNKNIKKVLDLMSYSSLINPTELNSVLYNITRNYPTLIIGIFPWYNIDYDQEYNIISYTPNFNFGNNIIKSYENHEYNKSFCHRIFSCFYCKSSCLADVDDGNPFTKKREDFYYNLNNKNKEINIDIKENNKEDIKNLEIIKNDEKNIEI